MEFTDAQRYAGWDKPGYGEKQSKRTSKRGGRGTNVLTAKRAAGMLRAARKYAASRRIPYAKWLPALKPIRRRSKKKRIVGIRVHGKQYTFNGHEIPSNQETRRRPREQMKFFRAIHTRAGRVFGAVHGPQLIHEAHSLFDGILAKLEAGVHHSREAMLANHAVIEAKAAENDELAKAIERAQNTATNIRALIHVDASH